MQSSIRFRLHIYLHHHLLESKMEEKIFQMYYKIIRIYHIYLSLFITFFLSFLTLLDIEETL